MTKKQPKESVNRALEQLYKDTWRDLSAEGYQDAMVKLRKTNANLARRLERQLAPFLRDKIFRRRRVDWVNTSHGLRARLDLLSENPRLTQDVRVVRKVLSIPDDQVKPTKGDPLWKELAAVVKPALVKREVEGIMAARWHIVHVQEAGSEKVSYDEDTAHLLSESMFKTAVASAHVPFTDEGVPSWLGELPSGLAPYDGSGAPLDWAVGRLVERHRLPWSVDLRLTFYILTENSDYLTNIELLSVSSSYSYYRPYETYAHTVSVDGIDEFVTKENWMHLWQRYIEPMQRHLWQERGQAPHGRRTVDISLLRIVLPIYESMVTKGIGIKDILANQGEDWDEKLWDMDQEAIRRAMKDLERLLTPKA